MNSNDRLTKEIQCAALDVLEEFQRVCKKYNLKYFAIGGTCIGAIRHKGFIPWDDDIDVAMPYPDYVKFMKCSKTELNSKYSVIGPHTCKHYSAPYIKLQNHETTFIEKNVEKYSDRYAGIYIDIFPIFGLPKESKKVWFVEHMCSVYNKINLRMRFEREDGESLMWKITWILCTPMRKLLHYDFFRKKQAEMLKKYKYNESDKVIFCWREIPKENSNSCYKNIFFTEDFSDMVEKPFENITIMVPNGYDRYLTMDFGNYMKLPPLEEQVARHPKAIVDLKKSYKYYLKKEW